MCCKIGTSGFSFDDWKGIVYPSHIQKGDRLRYYEQGLGFDTVELNFTYYTLPSRRTMDGVLRKTSPQFDFVVRSHKEMTHEIWTDSTRKELKPSFAS